KPFRLSDGMNANHGCDEYCDFQSVIGTTSRKGKGPTEFTLTTSAGRSSRISAPTAGSKSARRISLRAGVGAVGMEVFRPECLEIRQARVVLVITRGGIRRGRQDRVTLVGGKLTELCGG